MKLAIPVLVIFIFAEVSFGLNNGLGRVPQMGKRKRVQVYNLVLFFSQVGIVGIIFIVISMKI